MNERTTLEIIAPTVEEALAEGLAQLGLPADAVSVEVLDSGGKGLFGLGSRQVRVRLTVNPPGGPPVVEQKPAQAPKPQVKGAGKRNGAAPVERRKAEARKPERPVPAERAAAPPRAAAPVAEM